jgi:hypothetical protein
VGETPNQPFQLSFNAFLKIDFQGSRVTSDGGLILMRELDERLGFGELIQQHLTDSRRGKNTQFPFADLLRQSVYSRLAGYEDLNDAERLAHDPAFRLIGSEKNWDRGAALTSRLQSFETEMLAEEQNFAGLARLNRALIGRAEAVESSWRTILDMDSTEVPVYGEQEQSSYNGYFESTCFHPLLPRPVGRPSQKPLVVYKGFLYRAASWKTARRVVAKVEHHAGELFPRVGFIVTNLTLPSRAVVRFYNISNDAGGVKTFCVRLFLLPGTPTH